MTRIATWNLNNRVGKVRFRPEAAAAAATLDADVLVLTEYFPGKQHDEFAGVLRRAGYSSVLISREPTERANRVLVAGRSPITLSALALPDFDQQFPANLLAVDLEHPRLQIIGVRVPAYEHKDAAMLTQSWDWLARTGAKCCDQPGLIIGDLNIPVGGRGRVKFPEAFGPGWTRTQPEGSASYFGPSGRRTEIDHVLTTRHVRVDACSYVTETGGYLLAGEKNAISDHAALVVDLDVAADRDMVVAK